MYSCPKCNSNRISGPRYHKGGYGRYGQESLVYTCSNCGYERHEQTADADAQSQARLPHDGARLSSNQQGETK